MSNINIHRAVNGGNDEYFTNPDYAFHCCKIIQQLFYEYNISTVVEPSAGNGSFYNGIQFLCKREIHKSLAKYYKKIFLS